MHGLLLSARQMSSRAGRILNAFPVSTSIQARLPFSTGALTPFLPSEYAAVGWHAEGPQASYCFQLVNTQLYNNGLTVLQVQMPLLAAPGAEAYLLYILVVPVTPKPMPLLEEGAEVYLLYVRFRAAAEPNLKGTPCYVSHSSKLAAQHRATSHAPGLSHSSTSRVHHAA
eukprot:1156421-Pelagomonas_calceolata.AAC.10